MNGRAFLAPAAACPGPAVPALARPAQGSPPDPPEGNPLVIESFAVVALTSAARHHVTPVTNAVGWMILVAIIGLAFLILAELIKLAARL
jgi:hypothetical protein